MSRFILLLILLLTGCMQATETRLASNSGFGGTGYTTGCPAARLLHGESGFGGTGHSADCGFGGTGVIGTITDFGSIWVNGLEIELAPGLNIASNLGHPVKLAIGQQVITHTQPGTLVTNQVEVFYPIAGQIQRYQDGQLVINGQTITLDAHTQGLKTLHTGDWVAVSGWPQSTGHWLATRIDANPARVSQVERPSLENLNTRKALIEGGVVIHDKTAWLEPYHLKLGQAETWQNKQLALAALQRMRDGWQLNAVRALHQWQVDWHTIVREQHEQMRHMHSLHRGFEHKLARERLLEHHESLKDQHEALEAQRETLQESQDELREHEDSLKEQQSTLQDQKDILDEQRETLQESQEELREHEDSLKEQQSTLQDQKDILDEQRETLQESQEALHDQQDNLQEQQSILQDQKDMLQEQHEMLEEQHPMNGQDYN